MWVYIVSCTLCISVIIGLGCIGRIHQVRRRAPPKRPQRQLCIAALLGSGGHTAELLTILRALPQDQYTPRIYFTTTGDALSLKKAADAEGGSLARHAMQGLCIPRARVVKQSWLTTPLSVANSTAFCVWHLGLAPIFRLRDKSREEHVPWADVLIMNGPATCVPVVIAIIFMRVC